MMSFQMRPSSTRFEYFWRLRIFLKTRVLRLMQFHYERWHWRWKTFLASHTVHLYTNTKRQCLSENNNNGRQDRKKRDRWNRRPIGAEIADVTADGDTRERLRCWSMRPLKETPKRNRSEWNKSNWFARPWTGFSAPEIHIFHCRCHFPPRQNIVLILCESQQNLARTWLAISSATTTETF